MTRLRIVASRRFGTLSPLRYPGGKAALAGLFADVISNLGLRTVRYVEPYAGGAGAGIALLRQGLIDQLVINDIDPAVYAFWRAVVEHNDQLVELVKQVPLTIQEWRRQRQIYQRGDTTDVVQLGFAFFYLNRTNRSGILNAGVIGGQSQTGAYKMDARFNRDTLADRLRAIGRLANRIEVSCLDGRTVIQRYSQDSSTFFYIDPPYVSAGCNLYLNAFDARDHETLADTVRRIHAAHWVLTYDNHPLITRLYAGHFLGELEIAYSARETRRATEIIIASPKAGQAISETVTTESPSAVGDA